MARSLPAQLSHACSAAAIPDADEDDRGEGPQVPLDRQRQRLERDAGSHERQPGADPREERPLVGQAEARVRLLAVAVDAVGKAVGHGPIMESSCDGTVTGVMPVCR